MLHVITGPPCAGKSTYVREHAAPGDVRVDFDIIAQALGSETRHTSTGAIREAAFRARSAVVKYCLEHSDEVEAWIIHTSPSDWQMDGYAKAGADFVHLDEDEATCLARAAEDGRPELAADEIRAYFEARREKGARMDRQTKAARDAAQIDGGTVKGYASTFDREPDSYGDVIAKGAFAETLEAWREKNAKGVYIPLLYGHSTSDPAYNIGRVVDAEEDERGLLVTAEFDPENEKAQYVRKLVQEGRLYQFSFAFNCTDFGEVELEGGRKANELRRIDLFEVSLVQIPANQHAEVLEVKSAKSGRRNNKADEAALRELADKLRDIAEEASEAQTIVSGLLAEAGEKPDTQPEEEPEANTEEPGKANVEEQRRIEELLAKATKITQKGTQK